MLGLKDLGRAKDYYKTLLSELETSKDASTVYTPPTDCPDNKRRAICDYIGKKLGRDPRYQAWLCIPRDAPEENCTDFGLYIEIEANKDNTLFTQKGSRWIWDTHLLMGKYMF